MKKIVVMAGALALAGVAAWGQDKPTVLIKTTSQGNTINALRDQTLEVFNDFQQKCSNLNFVIDGDSYNYVVYLHHIEMGLIVRDNQLAILDSTHKIIFSQEKFSIKKNVGLACDKIATDWKTHVPNPTDAEAREAGITSKEQVGMVRANILEAQKNDNQPVIAQADLARLYQEGKGDRVIINSDQPDAELWLDGKMITHLPFTFTLLAKDKPRLVEVKLTGFKTWSQLIQPSGKTLPLNVHLIPEGGAVPTY